MGGEREIASVLAPHITRGGSREGGVIKVFFKDLQDFV